MVHPQQLNKDRLYANSHPRIGAAFTQCFNEDLTCLLGGERIPQRPEEQSRMKFFGGCCEDVDVVTKSATITTEEADALTLERVARREFMAETGYDTQEGKDGCFALLERINLTHHVGPDRKIKGYFVGLLKSSAQPCATRLEASEMRAPIWIPVANVLRGEHNGIKMIPQHQEAGVLAISHMMHLLDESIEADPQGERTITADLKKKRDSLSMEIAFALGSRNLSSLEEYAALIALEARQGIR
ncbi:MAG TPA: hypothetical protein VJ579_01990 [Candidatus Paceibacterota bacterium]|nr:hypothetical protein [Candidatus Paceibacterota bacterium]